MSESEEQANESSLSLMEITYKWFIEEAMTQEIKILTELENCILKNHESGDLFEEWCEDYDYVAVDFEGPYIDEETDEPDENCIMYLINVDRHLSERLKIKDKDSLPQEYDTLYGWIYLDTNLVDIVGFDNYHGEEKSKLIANLDAFLKHAKAISKK